MWHNKDRLNSLLSGIDQIDLTYSDMDMIARTFLTVVVKNVPDANNMVRPHLAADLNGKLDNPVDHRDTECNGWINLAEFNRAVYSRCEGVTLSYTLEPNNNDPSAYSPYQPYLHIGIHAALVALKQFRP